MKKLIVSLMVFSLFIGCSPNKTEEPEPQKTVSKEFAKIQQYFTMINLILHDTDLAIMESQLTVLKSLQLAQAKLLKRDIEGAQVHIEEVNSSLDELIKEFEKSTQDYAHIPPPVELREFHQKMTQAHKHFIMSLSELTLQNSSSSHQQLAQYYGLTLEAMKIIRQVSIDKNAPPKAIESIDKRIAAAEKGLAQYSAKDQ